LVINGTITGQSFRNAGGGIHKNDHGTTKITNSTIVGNSSGVFNLGFGVATLGNNIVVSNGGHDLQGTVTSAGHNLIGTGLFVSSQPGDQFGVTPTQGDLGPLADNGGPTQTIAIGCSSIGRDAGNDSVLDPPLGLITDQRGSARKIGSHVDTGAFEANSCDNVAPSTVSVSSPEANGGGWNNSNVSVSLTANDNVGGSGVSSITYSSSGAQAIGTTTVTGSSTAVSVLAEGTTTITYYATDYVGNVEVPKSLIVRIDKTLPSISDLSPVSGSYFINQVVNASYGCSDMLSGLFSCVGTTMSGAEINTASVGTKAFAVTATDVAGNVRTFAVNYTVVYRVPVTTSDCKNDGWRSLTRADGTPFKNQGDCVSFVNTGR